MAGRQLAMRPLGALMLLIVAAAACSTPASAYPMFGGKRYGPGGPAALPPPPPPPPRPVAAWSMPAPMLPAPMLPPHAPQTHYGYGMPAPAPFYSAEPVMSYPYPREFADSPEYYYGEPTFASYPYYYPGGNKYTPIYHHSMMPYYYGNPQQHPYAPYGYEEPNEPVEDFEDELQQEEEREEREEALPIGQETWFENATPEESAQLQQQMQQQQLQQQQQQQQEMADVNAIFLQNLILTQMYNDAMARGLHPIIPVPDPRFAYAYQMQEEDPEERADWVYGDIRAHADDDYPRSGRRSEDDDVRELKSLVKKDQTNKLLSSMKPRPADAADTELPLEGGSWVKPNAGEQRVDQRIVERVEDYTSDARQPLPLDKKEPEYSQWVPGKDITLNFSDRKNTGFLRTHKNDANMWAEQMPNAASDNTPSTTTPPPLTPDQFVPMEPTAEPSFDRKKGMKEVALPRPATPVRHRPSLPAFEPSQTQKPRHQQTVYQTIKHLINMQRHLNNGEEVGPDTALPALIRTPRASNEQVFEEVEKQSQQFKRFVSNEEALVEELSGLKKMSA